MMLAGCLTITLASACGGGSDSGSSGDGDGDGDTGGDGDGDGDGDTSGDGDMGGAPGDGDGDVQILDCTVEEQNDGSALISCPDGTELVVEPTEVGSMDECAAEKDTDGVFTVTCDGEDPIVFDPVPNDPELVSRALVKEGNSILIIEIFDTGMRRAQVPLPNADGSLGFYSLSPDHSALGYKYGEGLYLVDLSGDEPGDPVRVDDGAVAGGEGINYWQWVGSTGVYIYGDLDTVDQYEIYYASWNGSEVGDLHKLNGDLIADGDVYIAGADNKVPPASPHGIAFTADDQVDGQYEVFYADVRGDTPVTTRVNDELEAGDGAVHPVLLGPSGDTLLFIDNSSAWNIMVSDVSSGVPGTVRQVNDDLDGDQLSSLSVSPDGNSVAYARVSGGTSTIFVVDITDALPAAPQPTNLSGSTTTLITAFHSDSKQLLAYGDFNSAAQNEIYAIDVSGNQPADAIKLNHNLGGSETVLSAQLSRISERVIYGAGESAPTEYFVVNLDGTGREKVDHGLANGQSVVAGGFAAEADTYLYRVLEGSNHVAAYTIDLTADPVTTKQIFSSGGSDITWCGLSADASISACAANGGVYLGTDLTTPPVAAGPSIFFFD